MANQLWGWSGYKWMEAHRIRRLGQRRGHLVNAIWLSIWHKTKAPGKRRARFFSPPYLHAYPFLLFAAFASESFLFAFRHFQINRIFVVPRLMCASRAKPSSKVRKGFDSVRILQESLPHFTHFHSFPHYSCHALCVPLCSQALSAQSYLAYPHWLSHTEHFKSLKTYWLSAEIESGKRLLTVLC